MDLVELAQHYRDKGMSLAEAHADEASPLWSERAYTTLVRLARFMPKLFADDLRAAVDAPASPNAFGSVWMRAIRDGVLTRTAETIQSREPKRHRHRYFVYASNIYGKVS